MGRRIRRCAGCHNPHSTHGWGIPGPNCQGREDTISPSSPPDIAGPVGDTAPLPGTKVKDILALDSDTDPDVLKTDFALTEVAPLSHSLAAEKEALEIQLQRLALEERELEGLAILREKLAAKEATVSRLRLAVASSSLPAQQQPTARTRPFY